MNDFKLNTNLDMETANGDFVTGNSTNEHQELLLWSGKGEWKENPTIGVGVAFYLKDENPNDLLGEIKKEFERDGMTVREVKIEGDNIKVDAAYGS